MDQANVLGLKLPQCIAALKDSKLLFKKGERTEFHIKLTTNRERSIRKSRHSRRPILGFRATRRVEWGYGTARADTKLSAYVLPVCFPCFFFLCALGTQSVVCKIQTELPVPNLWPNSLGFRQHHRRCTVTGGGLGVTGVRVGKIEGWKLCTNWGRRSKSGLVVYIYFSFLFPRVTDVPSFFGELVGFFSVFLPSLFYPPGCCISAWYTEAVILIDC